MCIADDVGKQEDAELEEAIEEVKAVLAKIPDEEIIAAVRQSRDER